jgi:transcriptional regulator with XRE-family HTH domain
MSKNAQTSQRQHLQALLRQVRVDAGLRQADLAKRLKQSQSFISKYESGERRLDLLEIRQICEAVGITLVEFVSKLEGSLNEGKRAVPQTTQKLLGKRKKH